MASPHLVDPIRTVDAVDGLRLLVSDLQALTDRLGLKQNNRALYQSLEALEQQVFGPRTVVLLMGETAAIKRSFLERLLGPQMAHVPEPTNGPLRLEYGAEPGCSVILPQGLTAEMPLEQLPEFLGRQGGALPHQSRQTVQLPNPTLAKGLAVIDTPAGQTAVQDADWFREAAAAADCWIFVLGADEVVSERSIALLRQMPLPCPQLDVVIEGAETLSGEGRQAARERLLSILREHCGIEHVRLTMLASPAAEGDSGSFWHGRFATFQQMTLLRGREHWLHVTRDAVAKELTAVGGEIQSNLRGDTMDMQQARLRMGQKDLEALRARFDELGLARSEKPQAPSLVSAVVWPEASGVKSAVAPVPLAAVDQQAPATERVSPQNTASQMRPQPVPPPWRRAQAGAAATTHGAPKTSAPRSASPPLVGGWAAAQVRLRRHAAQARSAGLAFGRRDTPSGAHALTVNGVPYRAAVRNLSAAMGLLFRPTPVTETTPTSVRRRHRVLLVGAIIAAIWLVLWAVWPTGHSKIPAKTQWNSSSSDLDTDFELPPVENPDTAAATVPTRRPARLAGSREVIADPTFTDLGISRHALRTESRKEAEEEAAQQAPVKPSAAISEPASPAPSSTVTATDAATRKPSRRRLGLGKVWHWIRRDEPVSTPAVPGLVDASAPSTTP